MLSRGQIILSLVIDPEKKKEEDKSFNKDQLLNQIQDQPEQFVEAVPPSEHSDLSDVDDVDADPDYQTLPEHPDSSDDDYNADPEINRNEPLNTLLEEEVIPPKKKGRWSTPNPSNWAINKNKLQRKSGKPYKSKTGRIQSAKLPKNIDCSNCLYKCTDNFNDGFRLQMCSEYHNLSYDRQRDLLLQLVTSNLVERKRKRCDSGINRTISKKYYFIKDGNKVRVCKTFFLKTLCISHGPVDNAISNSPSGYFTQEDKRGKKSPPNKTKPDMRQKIKDHIEKFPTQESHYCRKSTKRKYLDCTLSISKMYELFKNECKISPIPSEYVYRQVFCTEYNLSFFKPKKDQCVLCTNYAKAGVQEKLVLKKEFIEHIERKDQAMKCKALDKERCKTNKNFMSATFDLQSVLQIPCSEVSQMYYSRKLSAFNLTVYEAAHPCKGHCFTWTEVNGQRGSSEIGTALFYWLQTLPLTVNEISLFSDSCSGQNRNQYIAALFLFIIKNLHFTVIEHKFLEKGHTYMEVDSMHSAIESAKKNVPVYVMQDWLNIFTFARSKRNRNKTGDPYKTKEFRFDDFMDLKDLAGKIIHNKTKDNEGNQVKWLKIKRMRYEKDKVGTILFSYDYRSEYKELNVFKRGRPCNIPTSVKKLYQKKLEISSEKKNDLIKLCKSNIVPEEYHHFYQTLPASSNTRNKNPEPDVLSSSDSE